MNVSEVLTKNLNREIKVDVPRDNIEDKLLSKLEELFQKKIVSQCFVSSGGELVEKKRSSVVSMCV